MPPQIRKWGSVTILTTIFTGLATTGLLWAFGEITDVAPLKRSVDTLITDNKTHHTKVDTKLEKILSLVHAQDKKVSINNNRLDTLENRCKETTMRLRDCEIRHFTITPVISEGE